MDFWEHLWWLSWPFMLLLTVSCSPQKMPIHEEFQSFSCHPAHFVWEHWDCGCVFLHRALSGVSRFNPGVLGCTCCASMDEPSSGAQGLFNTVLEKPSMCLIVLLVSTQKDLKLSTWSSFSALCWLHFPLYVVALSNSFRYWKDCLVVKTVCSSQNTN